MATEPEGNLGKRRFGPSDRLKAMFRACSRDPTEAIEARLRSMLQTFLQHRRDNAANESNGSWRTMQVKRGTDWASVTISVIELELRADVGLPHAVVTHLAQVEDKVLESMAWTSDSPLWEEIRDNEGRLPTCQQVIPPTQLEDLTRTDLQADENLPEAGRSLGREQSDRQRSPSAVNRPRRRNSLHIFARKVYRLMAMRLRELCSTLHISDELRSKIWTCFEYSLVNCTDLMIDRHLDQLVMCAIYIIAKGETPPPSPYPRQFKGSSRRRRLSSSHSIFISPYNTENTSRCTSGLCYYFNSSPPERLREINIMVKTGRSPIRRSLVSLDGDDEEENDGPSAKRLHLDDQSAWQRRLRNVENDRMTIRDRDQPSPVTKPNQY
ncbi:Retinoblastoma-like protein 2 130 kDa retinoblastoma-associated protein [Collichthys lucidus]|uniref:Retinoblastoma-like protein 2 130 kDa retinoblastoma-associated protein n=1 Tax=Collichthys lucidus TaxID=240159 RepID=A0A4U5U7D2_COLLU|nr:Retinoblastoma-like protein 2 130 kDa retinoblastoma-associated protein [Collichthys lucidus]